LKKKKKLSEKNGQKKNQTELNTTMERCVTYLHSSGDFPVGRKIKGEKKKIKKNLDFFGTLQNNSNT
jgi:hypothetical protein